MNPSPEELLDRSEYLGKVTKVVHVAATVSELGGLDGGSERSLWQDPQGRSEPPSPAASPVTCTCSSAETAAAGEGHWDTSQEQFPHVYRQKAETVSDFLAFGLTEGAR